MLHGSMSNLGDHNSSSIGVGAATGAAAGTTALADGGVPAAAGAAEAAGAESGAERGAESGAPRGIPVSRLSLSPRMKTDKAISLDNLAFASGARRFRRSLCLFLRSIDLGEGNSSGSSGRRKPESATFRRAASSTSSEFTLK